MAANSGTWGPTTTRMCSTAAWRRVPTTHSSTLRPPRGRASLGRPMRVLFPPAGIRAKIMKVVSGRALPTDPGRGTGAAKISTGDQLGHNADRDLGHRLRADGQAQGGVDPGQDVLRNALGDEI